MKKYTMKKLLALTLCVLFIFGFAFSSFALAIGDIDGKDGIKAADARLALRAAVKLDTLSDEQFAAADVNFDGEVTSADARLILRAAVGLEQLQEPETDPLEGAAEQFNSYVNPIKTAEHTISHIEINTSESKVKNNNIKFNKAAIGALLVASGEVSLLEVDEMLNAMEKELVNGLDYSETVNGEFYKNEAVSNDNFPIFGDELVSKLEYEDIEEYTVEEVSSVDFSEVLSDTYEVNSNSVYDTSSYKLKEVENLTKVTLVIKSEDYSLIKDSTEETSLMKVTNMNLRELVSSMSQMEGLDEQYGSVSCENATSTATIIYYFDSANENAPVAAMYDVTVECLPTLTFDVMGLISGDITLSLTNNAKTLYFFDGYYE